VDRVRVQQEIARLKTASGIASAESLCRLLQYLVDHALDRPDQPIKEHEIATAVFGRPSDFDPRLDAIVRVQTGRLRTRLAEYYAGPGADDPLIIDIPKGSYAVSVRSGALPRRPTATVTAAPPPAALPRRAWPGGWQLNALLALGFLAVITSALSGFLAAERASASSRERSARDIDPTLVAFWSPLLDHPGDPLVVFSNAEFVGRPDTGMRYFDAHRDTREQILDHYTGVGEVLAAFELTRLFGRLGREVRVKRGRLLALDDAKTSDVIFVGSPAENLSLREIPGTREFLFQQQPSGPRQGHVAIVNVRPRPGEPATFFASAALPIREDYALVSLNPGLGGKGWTMVLAGTTTLGTQAAVEFVCRGAEIQKLLARMPARGKTPFEAVLKVRISGGVPVETQIAAVKTGAAAAP
jgi:hypothetical protein